MEIDKTKKSEWGEFALIPKEGWKIGHTFIDYESGYLIVNETPEDISGIKPNEFGTRVIPNHTFIIDRNQGRILSNEEWRKNFNYNTEEFLVSNTNFKIVRERKANFKANNDTIEEKLVDQETGDVLYYSRGVGFHKDKRKSVYERHLDNEENKRKQKEKAASELTLEEFFFNCLNELNEEDEIIRYYDQKKIVYLVKFCNGSFLLQEGGTLPSDFSKRKNIIFKTIKKFEGLEELWEFITKNKDWFLAYKPFWINREKRVSNNILAKYVIHKGNKIRNSTNINWDNYRAIRTWENFFHLDNLKRSEIIQICPNCRTKVNFNGRYPSYICGNCNKLITDKNGRKLDFYNTSMGGGCQGYYKDTGEKYEGFDCFIGDKKFRATEARFGGIVIEARYEFKY